MLSDPRFCRGLNVLVVEDDPLIAFEVRLSLLDMGAGEVENAATVAEAMTSLGARRFDVGLLDYEIGTETVTEVARRMRQLGIPFVVSSAHEDLDLGHAFDGAGMLLKPFGFAELEEAIEKVVC